MASTIHHDEAVVTLTAVNPPSSFSFPSRHILLTKSKPTIFIGRTSKRNSSFEASESNAWIDSAVMSRDHAELRFDAQEQTVLIKDIGSLHGTFHNDSRLALNQVQTLKDGDMIQFGIAVDRGYDTFPPCTMQTAVKFGSASPSERPTVFRVPDDTDVEELSSDEDTGVQHSSQILRDHKIHPAQFQSAPRMSIVAIDLTSGDEADCQALNPGEAPLEAQSQEAGASQSSFLGTGEEISENPRPRMPTPPGTIDISDEELFCEESYNEEVSEEELSEEELSEEEASDDEASDDDLDQPSDVDDLPDDLSDDLPDETVHDNLLHDCQGTSASITQISIVQPYAPEPVVMDSSVKDIHFVHETGNTEHCFQHSSLPPIIDYSKVTMFPDWIVPPAQNRRLPSILEALPLATDASGSRSIAEILGEKTGKHEYFSAREANKMNVQKLASMPAEDQLCSEPLVSPEILLGRQDMNSKSYDKGPETADEPCLQTPSKALEHHASMTSSTEQVAHDLAMQSSSLLASGAEFINSPLKDHHEPISANPPVIDGTSAYQFELTKKAIAQQKVAAESSQQYFKAQRAQQQLENQRCRMEINQIVHILSNSDSPQEPQEKTASNKRKAADISEVTPEEELVELVNRMSPSPIPRSEPKPADCAALASTPTATMHNVSSLERERARPAKRLRKVAEIFGYAALGGVAVMSALIATAPTL